MIIIITFSCNQIVGWIAYRIMGCDTDNQFMRQNQTRYTTDCCLYNLGILYAHVEVKVSKATPLLKELLQQPFELGQARYAL